MHVYIWKDLHAVMMAYILQTNECAVQLAETKIVHISYKMCTHIWVSFSERVVCGAREYVQFVEAYITSKKHSYYKTCSLRITYTYNTYITYTYMQA